MQQRVKLKSLITRINRRLVKTNERLCKARPNEVQALGEYYLADDRQAIARCRIEPITFAMERNILLPGECVDGMPPVAAPDDVAIEAAPPQHARKS